MTYNSNDIEALVHKFQTGEIRPEELEILIDWYNNHNDEQVVLPTAMPEGASDVKARLLAGLLSKVRKDQADLSGLKRKFRFPIRWAAAALVLIVGLGVWVGLNEQKKQQTEQPNHTSIQPGGNKATLMLADGRRIDLSTTQSGIVVGEDITYIDGTRLEQGEGAYTPEDATALLKLYTPKGGTYQITLADGTRVWLNSASTLTYPTHFTGEDRVVELEGEAYFDVESAYRADGTKIPFRVRSKQQEIEVLGTQFNIWAYTEQPYTKTTLVEGKVMVKANQKQVTLRPGEQATTIGTETAVRPVDISQQTAWYNGKFSFDGKSFEEVLMEIGRWYDLTIVYENEIPQEELVGDAFRNQNIGLVLRLLDAVAINYELDVPNRKLIIKGKKTNKN